MQGGMMGNHCRMMGMAMSAGDGPTHAASRIAFLKAELGITDKQQPGFRLLCSSLEEEPRRYAANAIQHDVEHAVGHGQGAPRRLRKSDGEPACGSQGGPTCSGQALFRTQQ